MKSGGFDAVIGNPPYVLIEDSLGKEYLRSNYEGDEGKPDLYKYFVERSHKLLIQSGRFGMIIPSSLLKTPAYGKCRALLLRISTPVRITVFSGPVFEQAQVNCIVLVTKSAIAGDSVEWVEDKAKTPSEASLRQACTEATKLDLIEWRQAEGNLFSTSSRGRASWIDKLSSTGVTLGSLGKYTLGMQVYHNTIHSKAEMEKRISHSHSPGKGTWLRECRGTNVQRYFLVEQMSEWVVYCERCYNKPALEFARGPRLVIREITGETLNCAYTEMEHMPNKAVIIFRSDSTHLKYILGILNSRLIGKYVAATTEKGVQRLFPRISLRSVRTLPMPKLEYAKSADKARHNRLVALVDKMLGLMPKLRAVKTDGERATLQNAVTATDQQIDALVYELYGLTPEEIELVEKG
jgi:hypothetical protein